MSILEIRDVTKTFGGVMAINGLDLAVDAGELRCIIGPNGAGKTTLFNLISGAIEADSGQILYEGRPLEGLSAAERGRLGIGRKFQSPAIFGTLTVLQNLRVAAWGKASLRALTTGGDTEADQTVASILETIDMGDRRGAIAQELAHGEKQWLEIGMVLASRPSLLLLDEPTAGMTPAETHSTSDLIRTISSETTTIVIEHDLKFIREIANVVTVLHNGSVLAEGPIDDIAEDETVRQAYLGTSEL